MNTPGLLLSALLLCLNSSLLAAQTLRQCKQRLDDYSFQEEVCSITRVQREQQQGHNIFAYAFNDAIHFMNDPSEYEMRALGFDKLEQLSIGHTTLPEALFQEQLTEHYLPQLLPGKDAASAQRLIHYRAQPFPNLAPLSLVILFTRNQFSNLEQVLADSPRPAISDPLLSHATAHITLSNLENKGQNIPALLVKDTTAATINRDREAVYAALEDRFLSKTVVRYLDTVLGGKLVVRSLYCPWPDGNPGEVVVLCPVTDRSRRQKRRRPRGFRPGGHTTVKIN